MSGQHHRSPSINLHCTARGRPTSSAAVVCCEAGQLLVVVFVEACAGQTICRLCPPAVACSAGFVCLLAFAMPCPLPSSFLPPFNFALPPCSFPCAPGSSLQVVRTVLLAATTRACSGGPCAGFDFYLFPAESIDPGPWFSVRFVS